MNQRKPEWIAVKDITVRHEYLPKKETAARKHSILLKNKEPVMHVYRNQHGELLLIKGLDAYNTFKVIDQNKPLLTVVINKEITKLDWTFKLLHSCFNENVYFLVKYEYIMHLLEETKDDIKWICQEVGCSSEDILKYKIDKRVPDPYKVLALQHNRQKLVNDICRNAKFKGYRPLLYEAAFKASNRLTQDKLKIFQKFIDSGYHININAPDALMQLNKIVSKEQAYKTHWANLFNNDPSFKKGATYIRKVNKENNSIWMKLR